MSDLLGCVEFVILNSGLIKDALGKILGNIYMISNHFSAYLTTYRP